MRPSRVRERETVFFFRLSFVGMTQLAADNPASRQREEDTDVSVSTRGGAAERRDGTPKPDDPRTSVITSVQASTAAGNDGGGEGRIGSERGTQTRVSASGSRLGDTPCARQSVTEFIDAYAASVASLASRLDELLHSIKDVPSDELDALVRREGRLFFEFVEERREEFDRALGEGRGGR